MPLVNEQSSSLRHVRTFRYTQRAADVRPVETAHHLVKFLDLHRRLERLTRNELAHRAGLGKNTLNDWWMGKKAPDLRSLELALEVFGYELKPTPMRV